MRTGSPGHLRSFSYVGVHRYSLTFCTDRRIPHFVDQAIVYLVLTQIVRAAEEHGFAVVAYCFMPDHLHLLVEGQSDDSDCKRFIARAKQYSGFYFAKVHGGTLWQRYGFEHVLRDDEVTLVVARYIVQNPIRAGLVERIEDYPYVGSLAFTLPALLEAISSSTSG